VDKIKTRFNPLAIFGSFIFFFLFSINTAIAQNSWSFEDNPHPRYNQLSEQEKTFLNDKSTMKEGENPCKFSIRQEYAVYLDHYPNFSISGEEKTNFKNWKIHYSRSGKGYFISCLSVSLAVELMDTYYEVDFEDFYFCGQYSRLPNNKAEQEAADIIDEIFEYAKTYRSSSSSLLYANSSSELIDLNPDIEYYFSKLVNPLLKDEIEPRDVSHLIPLLSEEKRAFLDEAALNFDFQPVLDTTEPCKTR